MTFTVSPAVVETLSTFGAPSVETVSLRAFFKSQLLVFGNLFECSLSELRNNLGSISMKWGNGK